MSNNSTNPFPGLQSYGHNDSNKLFGRDRDVILMKDRIFSARTTLLFAGSGVGKTSFLNAKIIPDLEDEYCTFYHSRWAGPATPLEAVKTTLAQRIDAAEGANRLIDCFTQFSNESNSNSSDNDNGDGTPPHKRCLLVFDQFEEIFQYHAYEDYFKQFLTELCEVVRREEYRVHIIFSMREEYLGELSVFDNLIPDLFTNYYRLKYPDKREAQQIIEGTCDIAGAKVDRKKMEDLIRDLSRIEKGVASAAERSTHDGNAANHVIERSFIIPPYLQIVCHRQWEEQTRQAVNDKRDSFIFLEDYQPNQAKEILSAFCEERLSKLSFLEQNVAEKSFDFLVTKQGAKMAYEFTSLADHMRLRFFKAKLKEALNKLSDPQTRILRRSHGPDGSLWFELYHDIYGRILDTWRESFRRRKRRVALTLTVSLLALLTIGWFWGVVPYWDRSVLKTAHLERPADYLNSIRAYDSLHDTFGYRSYAQSWLAEAWERRAQYAESRNERDEAIICWLHTLNLDPESSRAPYWRLKIANLIGGDYHRLRGTLPHENEVKTAVFSDDGQLVFTKTIDDRLSVWNSQTGDRIGGYSNIPGTPPAATAGVAGERVSADRPPSSDQSAGVTSRSERNTSASRGGERSVQRSAPDKYIIKSATSNKEVGWLAAVVTEENQDKLTDLDYAHQSSRPAYFSMPVEILSSRGLTASIQTEAKITRDAFAEYKVALSPEGKFVATTGKSETTRVWRVENNGTVPADDFKFSGFVDDVIFSPDGRSLLTRTGNQLSMWDVESKKLRYSPLNVSGVDVCAFQPNGEQFVCLLNSPKTGKRVLELRKTDTGEALGKPISATAIGEMFVEVRVTPDNKILVSQARVNRGLMPVYVVNPADGEVQSITIHTESDRPWFLSPNGAMGVTYRDNAARLFDIDATSASGTMLKAGDTIARTVLSKDGARVTTLINHARSTDTLRKSLTDSGKQEIRNTVQVWDAKTVAPIATPIHNVAVLSDDGAYVAKFAPGEVQPVPKAAQNKNNDTKVQILNVTGDEVLSFTYPAYQLFTRLLSSSTGRFFATHTVQGPSRPVYEPESVAAPSFGTPRGDGLVYLWSRDDPSGPIAIIPSSSQHSASFSEDDRFFGVSGPNSSEITVWDLQTKRRVDLPKNLPYAGALEFSREGHLIAGALKKVTVWDLNTRKPLNDLEGTAELTSVAMDHHGSTALTGDANGAIFSWKFGLNAGPKPVGDDVRHREPPMSIDFTTDGRTAIVVAGNWLHTITVNDNRYAASYFLGPTWSQQCRNVNESGTQFKCLFKPKEQMIQVKVIESAGLSDVAGIEGDAPSLLSLWKKRLGLTVNDVGKIIRVELQSTPSSPNASAQ